MDIKSFFKNWIVRNLLLAALFVVLLVVAVNLILAAVTRHNDVTNAPDLSNMTVEEALDAAAAAGVRAYVSDSVYVRGVRRGVVFSQTPSAGNLVKKGRRIQLTINATTSRKVVMPSLVGCSMRQAKAELISKDLILGRLIYRDDIATNNVLRQLYRNREIRPGTELESGSVIDLVVGLNYEDNRTYVPDVVTVRYPRAVDAVQDNSLNVGLLVFDSTVKSGVDSLNAVVYKQTPVGGSLTTMGANVSLYLTLDIPSHAAEMAAAPKPVPLPAPSVALDAAIGDAADEDAGEVVTQEDFFE